MRRDRRRGAALGVTIIICLLLSLTVGALLSHALNERRDSRRSFLQTAAFHFAEAGLDFAGDSIVRGESWVASGGVFRQSDAVVNYELRLAVTSTRSVRADGTAVYAVRSIARAVDAEGDVLAERAVAATYEIAPAGGFGWPDVALAARTSAKLNTSGNHNRITIASYDSKKLTFPYMVPGTNDLSFSSGVGVSGSGNGALEIFNARVWGTVQTGGGTVSYQAENPPIITVDAADPNGFHADLISTDFNYAFPALPKAADLIDGSWMKVTTYSTQNAFANANGTITFGTDATSKTYVDIKDQMVLSSSKRIVINGEVVIAHQSQDLLQFGSSDSLRINSGGKLTIITAAKVQVSNGLNGTWSPSQLELFTSSNQEIVMKGTNVGRFFAPNAKLHLADGAILLGQVVANTTDITNGSAAYYDESMSSGRGAGSLVLADWQQRQPDAALRALFE